MAPDPQPPTERASRYDRWVVRPLTVFDFATVAVLVALLLIVTLLGDPDWWLLGIALFSLATFHPAVRRLERRLLGRRPPEV